MFDFIGLAKEALGVTRRLMDRYWGTQTKKAATLEEQAEEAAQKKREALDKRYEAIQANNRELANQCLADADFWNTELERLQGEIRAKAGTG